MRCHAAKRTLLATVLLAPLAFSLLRLAPAGAAASNKAESFVLPNGLRVIAQQDSYAPLVALQLWVQAGSANESAEEAGVAHLLEHVLFLNSAENGAKKIAAEVEKLGGAINGFTTRDHTVYHLVLPAAHVSSGLGALARLLRLPILDESRFKNEAQVVTSEWTQNQDNPRAQVSEALFAAAYRIHPYGRSVIGNPESLNRLTWQVLADFHRRWYTARNMILVVTGDFDAARLKDEIENRFGALLATLPEERRIPVEPPQTEPRLSVLKWPISQAYLMLGFPMATATGQEAPVLDLLAFLLGRGESARLAETLKITRGLVNSISASTFSAQDRGLFLIEAQLEADKLPDALAAILEEVYRLREDPIYPWELSRAYANFERTFVRNRETLEGHARQLGSFASLYGDPNYGEVYLSQIRRIDAAELQRVARTVFKPEALAVALLVPEGTPNLPDLERIVRLGRKTEEPATVSRREDGVLTATLANGLRILIQEDRRLPLVAAHAAVVGGLAVENNKNNGIGHFLAAMLTQGTPQRSSSQLIRTVEQLGGSLGAWAGYSTLSLGGTFPAVHGESGLDLFLDALLHPTFPEDELKKKRREILLQIKNREERATDRALRFFYQTLLVNHPYRLDLMGQQRQIERFGREELAGHYHKLFSPERIVVTVVGDVKAEKTLQYLVTKLSPLRKSGSPPPLPNPENDRRDRRVAKREMRSRQSQVVLGFEAPAKGARDYFTMKVVEAILSRIGGRLFVDLRDNRGLAYSVGAYSLDDPLQGIFAVYAATDPANVEKIREGVLAQLRRLREEEVLPDELERAKNYLIGQYLIGRQTPAARAAELANNELFGFGGDFARRYQQEIQKVGAVDVLKFAWRYFSPDGYTLAVVGP